MTVAPAPAAQAPWPAPPQSAGQAAPQQDQSVFPGAAAAAVSPILFDLRAPAPDLVRQA